MATGRIGVTPNLRTRWSKAPAGGTTSLSGLDDNSVSLVYDAGFEAVYRNGVLLSRGNDYTATNGTTITLIDATIAGDIIEVFANQAIPLTSTYTQAVADSKFINNTLIDAKGDIITATADNTPARLAVGSNDQVLTADSTTSTGLKWATPAAGGMTSLASGSLAASATGFDLTSISGSYNELWLYITNYSTSTTADIQIRTNGNTVADYSYNYYETAIAGWSYTQGDNRFLIADLPNATRTGLSAYIRFPNYANSTGYKHIFWQAANEDNTLWNGFGFTRSVSAINRITFSTTAGTFDSGTYALFGVK